MKRSLTIFTLLCALALMTTAAWGQVTYTWTGATDNSWLTTTNWSPTRTTPANNDIIQFNAGGTVTVTAVPTQTIGQLVISGSTTVNLQAAGAVTLTITGTGSVLSVASGSALNCNVANAITINITTGGTGSISGAMTLSNAAHRLTAADASGITFQSGSTFTEGTAFSGNPFGTTNLNSIVFASGSTFIFIAGSNPFGATQPSSVVVFQAGSLYKHQGSGTPGFSGRSYANFELNIAATTITVTGGFAVSINNLTITAGTLNFNMTLNPGHSIKGNIAVASGATLNFAPATAGTVNLNGSALQSINGPGTITTNIFSTIAINNSNGISLGQNISIVGMLMMTNGTLTLNSATLSYSSGTLVYNGTSPQVSTDAEFPSSSGPQNLVLNNSAGVTIHAARTVTGMLTLGGNNSYTNLSNVSGYSGITYFATTAQTTGAEFGGSITNLVINNSNGVTLGGSKGVTTQLSMISGNIALGGNTLTLGTSAAAAGILVYTSGFMTGSGTFARWIPTTGLPPLLIPADNAGRFPMGVGTNDRTVLLAFSAPTITTGGTISVSHADATGATTVTPFTDGSLTINKQSNMTWTVAQSGLNLGSTTINTQITAGGIGSVTALGDITFTQGASVAGGTYVLATGTTSVPLMSRTGMGLTDIANTFYIGATSNSPLPVELASFTAACTRTGAMLVWKTATEKNNFGFNIERRTVGSSVWSKIGFVAGHGISNIENSYSYTDANVASGTYAYRISQIDNDGTVKTYNESQVSIGAAAKALSLSNYPNPFNPTTTLEFSVPNDGLTTVKIYNILGQELITAFSGEVKAGQYQHATFDGSKFSSGVYFYTIENNGQRIVKKMLMMK
jgi:Secretion system C-terminal sorting domain